MPDHMVATMAKVHCPCCFSRVASVNNSRRHIAMQHPELLVATIAGVEVIGDGNLCPDRCSGFTREELALLVSDASEEELATLDFEMTEVGKSHMRQ